MESNVTGRTPFRKSLDPPLLCIIVYTVMFYFVELYILYAVYCAASLCEITHIYSIIITQ